MTQGLDGATPSTSKAIPVFRPCVGDEELSALRQVLESGWMGLGPKTAEFEERFAEYVGAPCAVGLHGCTAALHLALKVLGVGPGDEVITTPMTFVSTNHAILYVGATPVFCDIEFDTLNIDPYKIEHLITRHTAAIMVVHYGGHPCDMDIIHTIANRHRLKVIEDAAHACGAEYKGRRVGSLSDATCFSFHAVKNLAAGAGGAITVKEPMLGGRLRCLRWMGVDKNTWDRESGGYSWHYEVDEVGFPYHMHDVTAAIALAQLEKLDAMNARRREIVQMYNEGLGGLDWIETPVEKPYAKSACHNYVVKLDNRDDLIAFLKDKGISTGVHYIPNHLHGAYKPQHYRYLPVAESAWERIVTLPLFPDLTEWQVEYIIEAIKEFGR